MVCTSVLIHTLPAFSKYSRKRLTSFSMAKKNSTFDLKNFTFIYFLPFLFLLFLFSSTLSRFVHVWGQGYRVTGGGSKAPLFLFLFPLDLRDIFLNLSLGRGEILSLVLSLNFSGLSLKPQTRMVERFLRDILGFVLVPRDISRT